MRFLVFAVCITVVPSSFGIAESRAESRDARSPEIPDVVKLAVLSRARGEIVRLRHTLPDKPMMKALCTIGFSPTVTFSKGRWHVVHPLGHIWAISRIHLEFDLRGKLLSHRFEPGE